MKIRKLEIEISRTNTKYKIIPNKTYNENDYIRELLDASYQGVKRLFVLAYRECGGANRVTADSSTEDTSFQE